MPPRSRKKKHDPKYDSLEPITQVPEYCQVPVNENGQYDRPCGAEIKAMAYKGTGACGEAHLKIKTRDYEGTPSAKS